MSVLYQALKRHDQLERMARQPEGSVYQFPQRKSYTALYISIAAVLVFALGGLYAYQNISIGLPAMAQVVMPVAAAPAPMAAPVAVALMPHHVIDDLPPEENKAGNEMGIVDINDANQIAALMPDVAREPLPTKPVQVDDAYSDAAVQSKARALQSQGANDAALKLYEQGGGYTSEVNKWGLIAEADPKRALPELKALVDARPDNAAAHAQLAFVYTKLENMKDAETEYKVATALAPENAQIWYDYAIFADQKDMKTDAIDAYSKALIHVGDGTMFDKSAVQSRLNYLRSS